MIILNIKGKRLVKVLIEGVCGVINYRLLFRIYFYYYNIEFLNRYSVFT